jgi:hypothetical protein
VNPLLPRAATEGVGERLLGQAVRAGQLLLLDGQLLERRRTATVSRPSARVARGTCLVQLDRRRSNGANRAGRRFDDGGHCWP